MTQYQVDIAQAAQADLRNIVLYIQKELHEPQIAQNLYRALRTEILSLDHMPERCPLLEDEPWRSRGLRKLLVKHYQVIYLVNREVGRVQVARVIYAGRDISKQLWETDWN